METERLKSNEKIIAVGYCKGFLDNTEKQFWLTNKENKGSYSENKTITGTITGTEPGADILVKDDGHVVYRNSRLGGQLIGGPGRKSKYKAPKGFVELKVNSLTTYIPNPDSADATDLIVSIVSQKKETISSLRYYLDELQKSERARGTKKEVDKLTLKAKKAALEEQEEFKKEIALRQKEFDELEKQEAEYRNKAKSFIRKSMELRHQPILDPWQEDIKRSHIYKNTVAIDGGPGTGKTTCLIQRMKFLTDESAMLGSDEEEGYLTNISQSNQRVIFSKKNWIFFSPNELLKQFLRNSMIQEGLSATDDAIYVWENYRNTILKDYKFINTDTKRPFLILNKRRSEPLLPVSGKGMKAILISFENFYLNKVSNFSGTIIKENHKKFIWHELVTKILSDLNKKGQPKSFKDAIRLFLDLERQYSSTANIFKSEYDEILVKSTRALEVRIRKNGKFEIVNQYFEKIFNEGRNISDLEIDSDAEEEELDEEQLTADLELFKSRQLKNLIARIALETHDSKTKLNSRQKEIYKLISDVIDITTFENFSLLAEIAYFNKYYLKFTRGITFALIRPFAGIYKLFRSDELKGKTNTWNFDLLKYIVIEDKEKNKRIHPHEQSLLIYLVNTIIQDIYTVSRRNADQINHSYFQAYSLLKRPVIGIDEATDFHLIDILAMHSLAHNEISSVTFSGDLMQRLTNDGIRDWDELKFGIKNLQVMELKVSYRQSPTLLEVASSIYQKATKRKAEYISFQEKDDLEPSPLLYISDNEENKLEWLSARIIEIYKAYGNNIPAIAIFLPNESSLDRFAHSLGELEELSDIGINVVACSKGQILGDKNSVRVFSIDYVKGLEFEAAFFYDIDKLYEREVEIKSEELILKNIYVGLSRASHYLGVTATTDSVKLDFLKEVFDKKVTDWE